MEWLKAECSTLFPSLTITCTVGVLIICACLAGDHLLSIVSQSSLSGNGHVIRAFIDNSTHALVGALLWAFVENTGMLNDKRKWLNCLFCAFLAASVDLDHFMAAGSLDFKKALSLPKRPPFHNTTLVLVLVVLLWTLQLFKPGFKIFSLMFLSSWLSHHLRDANHRGLWLSPFDHTPIFSSSLYVTLIIMLGIFVRILYCHCVLSFKLDNIVNSNIV